MSDGLCSCDLCAIFDAKDLRASDADEVYLRLLFHQDMAGPELIKFGVESKKSCKETSTETLIDAIALALKDMRDICVKGSNLPLPAARL